MSKYGRDSVAWNLYSLHTLAWEPLSKVSDTAINVIMFKSANAGAYNDLWQNNGTLSIKVR